MTRKKARRGWGRSPHRGVSLVRSRLRSGQTAWIAKWKHPLTGKWQKKHLDALGLRTDAARRDWAIRQARELDKLRQARALAASAPGSAPTTLEAAVAVFVEGGTGTRGQRLTPATIKCYRETLCYLARWTAGAGLSDLAKLNAHALAAFAQWLPRQQRQVPLQGGSQGEKTASDQLIGPANANKVLRHIKAFLGHCRRMGWAPQLTRDALTDSLRPLRAPRSLPAFLSTESLTALLEAALRHDAATFEATRAEHQGDTPLGLTPRHRPVAPLILTVLMTGCRIGEALSLRWDAVHLRPRKRTGHLTLAAAETKTASERRIDLAVSPTLITLLTRLRLAADDAPHVFGGSRPLPRSSAETARKRLVAEYAAPPFTWQRLRQTTASYLVNAPSIYGGASAWHAAKRLGHGVTVAERHYQGLITDIDPKADTLEAAMEIDDLATRIAIGKPLPRRKQAGASS